ncbi:MAG: hypothetical protein IAE81_21115 [Caldilineaceae bacterium]|jgi:predicted flap endonuclease-1-like 5' DNA nuclease|nr:hypothetical protein [Caldilineaceae bacterium]
MRKGLQVVLWSVLAGLTTFLALLLKQKNEAVSLAQARLARLEQRMNHLTSDPSDAANAAELRTQLAQKTAEVEHLNTLIAELQRADDIESPPALRTAAGLAQDAQAEEWRQRFVTETSWHAKAPALVTVGRALENLTPAKLAYADQAVQARVVPTVIAQPQDLSAVAGVGAIYEQRLYNAGIGTYFELASLEDDALRRILKLEKVRAAMTDLDAIRASARALAAEHDAAGYIWTGEAVDDFEPIKGIGKVYEQRLYNAGIRTYTALAQATPEDLLAACQSRSPVAPDVAGWISQAKKLAEKT